MFVATGLAVLGTLAVTVWAGPLWDMSERAAADLVDPTSYIEEVLR